MKWTFTWREYQLSTECSSIPGIITVITKVSSIYTRLSSFTITWQQMNNRMPKLFGHIYELKQCNLLQFDVQLFMLVIQKDAFLFEWTNMFTCFQSCYMIYSFAVVVRRGKPNKVKRSARKNKINSAAGWAGI